MMENNPDKINDRSDDRLRENDAELQIEATIFKQGQDYAARNQRSKAENKGRAESRAKIKAIGMNTNAYATAVRLIKDLTPGELADWRRDFDLVLKVMGSKQKELFPEEQLKAEQRIARQQEKAAGKPRSKAELDAQTDSNERSDPNSGGAQIDIEEAIANADGQAPDPEVPEGGTYNDGTGKPSLEEREAAEGEQALAEAAPSIAGGKKQSQSEKGKAIRDKAGLH
jgi:hypothetical protein